MKVSHVIICSNKITYVSDDGDEVQDYTVIDKLWFVLEDDVYEKTTNKTNLLELNQHGVDKKNETCARFFIPHKEEITKVKFSHDVKLDRFVKFAFETNTG